MKQGQGTSKEDTTPTSSPTDLYQPGKKREGRSVGFVKMHEQQCKYSLVSRNPHLNSNGRAIGEGRKTCSEIG